VRRTGVAGQSWAFEDSTGQVPSQASLPPRAAAACKWRNGERRRDARPAVQLLANKLAGACPKVGLLVYPIATSHCSSATLYQVSYRIQSLLF
jgi:hypothetical protein